MKKPKQSVLGEQYLNELARAEEIIRSSEHWAPPWPVIRLLAVISLTGFSVTLTGMLRHDLVSLDIRILSFAIGILFAAAMIACHQLPWLKVRRNASSGSRSNILTFKKKGDD